jgi:hypothetical protein
MVHESDVITTRAMHGRIVGEESPRKDGLVDRRVVFVVLREFSF